MRRTFKTTRYSIRNDIYNTLIPDGYDTDKLHAEMDKIRADLPEYWQRYRRIELAKAEPIIGQLVGQFFFLLFQFLRQPGFADPGHDIPATEPFEHAVGIDATGPKPFVAGIGYGKNAKWFFASAFYQGLSPFPKGIRQRRPTEILVLKIQVSATALDQLPV